MKKLGKIAVKAAEDKYFTCKTVFPFDLFPNTVKLYNTELTIVYRKGFALKEVVTIQVKDILNVEMTTGPFFGSVKIYNRFFTDQHRIINWLSRDNAVKLRNKLNNLVTYIQKPEIPNKTV